MCLIVLAYLLVSFDILNAASVPYQLLNLAGTAGIVAVSLFKKDYPPATLNTLWAIIAAIALFRIFYL